MRKRKKIVGFFLMFIFVLGVMIPAYGIDVDEQQQRLKELTQQINRQRNALNDTKQKEKNIMGNIYSIERDITKTQSEITSLSDRVSYLEEKLAVTEDEINILEDNLEKQTLFLRERLVYIYEAGDVSYLEVLLAAEDLKDFLTRYDLLNTILEQDQDLIKQIAQQQQDLRLKKSEFEVQQRELQNAQVTQLEKKEILGQQKGEKQKVLASVQTERQQCENAVAELERASNQIKTLIRQAQSGGDQSSIGTGSYTWPTPSCSTITSPFGMRFHPILKRNKLHTGVDIGATYGSNIVAADSGKVVFSGYMNGYGGTIVIDHGAGMSTLYAHQSKRLVSVGDLVTKGDTIGKVGSTGWSTGPHLHFEVRVNGTPVNPMDYI
ncbi:MAG: peptidoglycan DD-metalloendopeptidase family protein [Bacillota bacterium]|nr:peptidoglycan DD-metalloendopeptidase family protein [Bacillota bacterium]